MPRPRFFHLVPTGRVRDHLLALTILAGLVLLFHATLRSGSVSAEPTLTGRSNVEVDAGPVWERLDQQDQALQQTRRELDRLHQRVTRLAAAVDGSAPAPPPEAEAEVEPPVDPAVDPDGPPIGAPSLGFTSPALAPDAITIYVSAEGNDRADGKTPRTAVQTPRAGYARLRDGFPDHLRFRAGDTFRGSGGAIGELKKSGRSADEPQVIGVYEDGPRPRFEVSADRWITSGFNTTTRHVLIQGLEAVAIHRDPDRPGFDPETLNGRWKQGGVVLLGDDHDVTIEDCKLRYFKVALVTQSDENNGWMTDITLHRNIVVDSYGHWDGQIGGHSQGIYAQYVKGLHLTENLWDHNGWHPAVPGAKRTKFNHNLYIQGDCEDVSVRGNLIARASAHGLQLRPGGEVIDNLFYRNALAMFTAKHPSVVRRNVVLASDDLGDDQGESRGFGITALPGVSVVLEDNIVSQKAGTFPHAPAIEAVWGRSEIDWLDGRPFRATVRNNRVYRWPYVPGKPWELHDAERAVRLSMPMNKAAQLQAFEGNVADDPDWVEPGRGLEGYFETLGIEPPIQSFLDAARARPRGQWDPRLSAAGANAWIRAGFATADPDR
jgi:hypothetical protein